ncbi:MAG: PAS domain S-box protein [Nitrospirae bacterium]|nr:MAG: PAS domain S-box protein [Nitrospirota bacterium]
MTAQEGIRTKEADGSGSADTALRHRIRMEMLISAVSTTLTKLKPEEIDEGINWALEVIGEIADVDRSYVFLFSEDGTTMTNTYEWCAEGIEPQIQRLQKLPVDSMPWFMDKMRREKTFHVPSVEDLPNEAIAEKTELEVQGIKSLIVVPMAYGKTLVGFVGFNSVRSKTIWTEEDTRMLKVIGDIFLTAIERKEMEEVEKALKSSREYAKNIIDSSIDMIISVDISRRIVEFNKAAEETFGYHLDEVSGKHVDILYADAEEGLKVHETTVEYGRHVQEILNRRKNGEIFPSLLAASVLRDANGAFIGVMGVSRDITQRKKAEEERNKLLHDITTAEQELKKRVSELEKFYEMSIDRELKMKELKKEIKRVNEELLHCRENRG